ncbi:hypothetical protein ANCDUO_25376 [Ancylostoma duodenale]|uniref:Uncharacterized protein n=1 Tax=Ancylostoma duodenale TaxID=51022 RepID=A0A0C2FCZ2_9BILA|nr:hypothetical protein ANCDUO_25376 [Ancylostoma duodenale]
MFGGWKDLTSSNYRNYFQVDSVFDRICGPKEGRWVRFQHTSRKDLLAGCVLGYGLGALGHGVLGELSGEDQADGGLDFAGGDRRAFVVLGKARSLNSDALKDVVHERVHDGHRLRRDTGVGVHLLQHTVDVDGVALLAALSPLLVSGAASLLALRGLLRSLGRRLWWHDARSTG